MSAKKEDTKTVDDTPKKEEITKNTEEKKVEPTDNSKELLEESILEDNESPEDFDMRDEDIEKEIEKATREGDKSRFIEAVGRRKTSSARVRLFTQGHKGIIVNGKSYTDFFPVADLQKVVEDPMEKLKCLDKFGVTVIVNGGGRSGQAEAIRHGIARTLVKLNPYFKKRLKKAGFLTRDSRMRERKKPGLKRARRAPQWSKR